MHLGSTRRLRKQRPRQNSHGKLNHHGNIHRPATRDQFSYRHCLWGWFSWKATQVITTLGKFVQICYASFTRRPYLKSQARIQAQKGGVVHSEGGVSYRNFRSGSKLLQGPGQINKQKKNADSRRGGGGVRWPKDPPCIRAWVVMPWVN